MPFCCGSHCTRFFGKKLKGHKPASKIPTPHPRTAEREILVLLVSLTRALSVSAISTRNRMLRTAACSRYIRPQPCTPDQAIGRFLHRGPFRFEEFREDGAGRR